MPCKTEKSSHKGAITFSAALLSVALAATPAMAQKNKNEEEEGGGTAKPTVTRKAQPTAPRQNSFQRRSPTGTKVNTASPKTNPKTQVKGANVKPTNFGGKQQPTKDASGLPIGPGGQGTLPGSKSPAGFGKGTMGGTPAEKTQGGAPAGFGKGAMGGSPKSGNMGGAPKGFGGTKPSQGNQMGGQIGGSRGGVGAYDGRKHLSGPQGDPRLMDGGGATDADTAKDADAHQDAMDMHNRAMDLNNQALKKQKAADNDATDAVDHAKRVDEQQDKAEQDQKTQNSLDFAMEKGDEERAKVYNSKMQEKDAEEKKAAEEEEARKRTEEAQKKAEEEKKKQEEEARKKNDENEGYSTGDGYGDGKGGDPRTGYATGDGYGDAGDEGDTRPGGKGSKGGTVRSNTGSTGNTGYSTGDGYGDGAQVGGPGRPTYQAPTFKPSAGMVDKGLDTKINPTGTGDKGAAKPGQ